MNRFIISAALTAMVCLVLVVGQSPRQIRPRSFCQGGDIFPLGDNCATQYTRCDGNVFIRGGCVDSMVIGPNMTCVRRPECDAVTTPIRVPQRRGKRQASADNGCPRFDCDPNLLFYIYPNWDDCTQFYTCSEGQVDQVACSEFGYTFYNPNLFSCEVDMNLDPITVQDNICVSASGRY